MVVEASGIDAAGHRASHVTWTLVAEAGDGPVIPTLPALAAIRALAAGNSLRAGAAACAGVLDLEMIAAEFAPYRLTTVTKSPASPDAPLFARALGERFGPLPKTIRQVHSPQDRITLSGTAAVEGPVRVLPKIVRRVLGFPRPGNNIALRVEIEAKGGTERWTRDFARAKTRQHAQRSTGPRAAPRAVRTNCL